MEEILFKLLESSPKLIFFTIFLGLPSVLGTVIYFTWKKVGQLEKQAITERKAHKKELKEEREKAAEQIEELNKYIRESDKDTINALNSVESALGAFKVYIENNTK